VPTKDSELNWNWSKLQ